MRQRPRITMLRLMGALAAGASVMAQVAPRWTQAAKVAGSSTDWEAAFLWSGLAAVALGTIVLLESTFTEIIAALAAVHFAAGLTAPTPIALPSCLGYYVPNLIPHSLMRGAVAVLILLWVFRRLFRTGAASGRRGLSVSSSTARAAGVPPDDSSM